jgi:hypothetical protein
MKILVKQFGYRWWDYAIVEDDEDHPAGAWSRLDGYTSRSKAVRAARRQLRREVLNKIHQSDWQEVS